MNTHKGFVGIAVMIVLGLAVLGGAGYVALHPELLKPAGDDGIQTEPGDHMEVDHEAEVSIQWEFNAVGDVDGIPQTKVSVRVGDSFHEVGTYAGSCTEVGASGGVDGAGLLAGELSAAQCWFAGGGDEIGVFAHEDGGYEIMVGELGEPTAEEGGFRGNFKIKQSISL